LGGGEGNQGDNKREEIKIKKGNRKEKKKRKVLLSFHLYIYQEKLFSK